MLGLCDPVMSFALPEDLKNEMEIMFGDSQRTEMEKMKERFTLIDHLSLDYPKTFVWQTVEDEQVPYETNGKEIYTRLEKLGVPCRLKTVQHGLGLGEGSEAAGWLEEAVEFWKESL